MIFKYQEMENEESEWKPTRQQQLLLFGHYATTYKPYQMYKFDVAIKHSEVLQ